MAIKSRYKLKTGEEVAYFPPIQNTDSPYATEAAMHADQANQLQGYGYLVDGVGAFTYLGTLAGTAADYEAFGANNAVNANIIPFIIKWNATSGVTLTMPISATYIGLVKIDWGDGIANYENSHIYNTTGEKTISIYAERLTFTGYAASMVGLTEVVQWGSVKWQRLIFNTASNLTILPASEVPDFIECTTIALMFRDVPITSIPPNFLDRAINIVAAYQFCKGSNIDSIPDNLFSNCSSLKDIHEAFMGTNISVIPTDILKGAISITNINALFRDAGVITSIPEELFYDCINLEDVGYTFWQRPITSIPINLFKYNDKIKSFEQTFRDCPITGRVPELWMRYPNAISVIAFDGATGADNWSTIPDTWGGNYTGGFGKMLSAYIWEGSQADFDAQSQAWKDDPNIIHIIDGYVVGLDVRASNLASDLTTTEQKTIKDKLKVDYRDEKYIDGSVTPNYTLVLEDKHKFLNIRLSEVAINIPTGVFANGDVIKGYCYTGNAAFTSDLGYTDRPNGTTNKCWGYFEIRISSTSVSTPNSDAALITGEFIKEIDYLKSANGTIWQIEVSDAGAITATDSLMNF